MNSDMQQIILRKKVGEIVYDLMAKTTASMVYNDGIQLSTKLATIDSDIADVKNKLTILIGENKATAITTMIDSAITTAIDKISDTNDTTSLGGKIANVTALIDSINDQTTGILAQSKTYTDNKLNIDNTGYTDVKSYIESIQKAIMDSIAGALHFKGVVDYVGKLPTSGTEGDVYYVKYSGTSGSYSLDMMYVYDGKTWNQLGSMLDLSEYMTSEQITNMINDLKSDLTTTLSKDASTKANNARTVAIETASNDATYKAINAEANSKAYTDSEVGKRSRFIVSVEEPEDRTDNDIWAQIL